MRFLPRCSNHRRHRARRRWWLRHLHLRCPRSPIRHCFRQRPSALRFPQSHRPTFRRPPRPHRYRYQKDHLIQANRRRESQEGAMKKCVSDSWDQSRFGVRHIKVVAAPWSLHGPIAPSYRKPRECADHPALIRPQAVGCACGIRWSGPHSCAHASTSVAWACEAGPSTTRAPQCDWKKRASFDGSKAPWSRPPSARARAR